jgi:hypothetical protein
MMRERMRIIILTGTGHSYKTTTLNLVYDALTQGMNPLPPKQPIQYGSPRDFECQFLYQGKPVAIFSLGDTLYRVIDAIIRYAHVDVLILALSKKGGGVQRFENSISSCPNHYVHQKTSNNTQDCTAIVAKV